MATAARRGAANPFDGDRGAVTTVVQVRDPAKRERSMHINPLGRAQGRFLFTTFGMGRLSATSR